MDERYKNTGFKVPEEYFEGLANRLVKNLYDNDFPKSPGFTVPDGYFDLKEQEVLSEIKSFPKNKSKTISLFPQKFYYYVAGIAACAILLVSLLTNQKNEVENLANIPFTEVENYVDKGNLNITIFEMTHILEEENISQVSNENNIEDENLENYLIQNLDDLILYTD